MKFMATKKMVRTLGSSWIKAFLVIPRQILFVFSGEPHDSCDSSSCQKAGLPLIGLALGFLAPSGAKAKARSNLAAELPVRYYMARGRKSQSNGETNKCCGDSRTTIFWIGWSCFLDQSVGLKKPPAAKGFLDSGIWKQFPLPGCWVAVGPIF